MNYCVYTRFRGECCKEEGAAVTFNNAYIDTWRAMEKIFRTKTGFCHLTDDKIILTRDGVIGNVSKVVVGDNIARILVFYMLLAATLIYLAYNNYQKGDTTVAAIFVLLALYLVYGVVKSRKNTASPIIERKDIKSVAYNPGIRGLTRPRFTVTFVNEHGQMKQRLIMLPGTMSGGQAETKTAVQIMTDEGLLKLI